jgi:hypothetical protein
METFEAEMVYKCDDFFVTKVTHRIADHAVSVSHEITIMKPDNVTVRQTREILKGK